MASDLSPELEALIGAMSPDERAQLERALEKQLGILGRERALTDKLAKVVHAAAWRLHPCTPIRDLGRGAYFEVRMMDGKEPSGRVARVTVEFDRLETEEDRMGEFGG